MKPAFIILALGLTVFTPESVRATPFEECPIEAFLIQGNPSQAFGVQLGTGYYKLLADNLGSNSRLNGAGFSYHDGYIYGYSYSSNSVARMGSDYQLEPIEVVGLPQVSFYVGDVSVTENTYVAYRPGSSYGLYRVDLSGSAPHAAERIVDGATLNLQIYDLAFHPDNGFAYAVDRKGYLWQIDTDNGDAERLGDVGVSGTFGAAYFDVNGTLYVSRNSDGKIYRINPTQTNPTAELFALGPASGNNDGARCALAPITSGTTSAIDFGDAPESYGSYLADNGARHDQTNSGLYLGAQVDTEADAWVSPQSDDSNGTDDDDGVTFVTGIDVGSSAVISVNASGFGFLNGWLDFDGNGQFDDEEQIVSSWVLDDGDNALAFDIPIWAQTGDTWARFRFSSQPDLGATGGTSDGEVEDYLLNISAANLEITHYPSANGWSTVAFEDTWPLQGDYDMNDVVVHQRLTQYRDNSSGNLVGVRIRGEVAALGASFHNGFGVRLPGVKRSEVDTENLRFSNSFGATESPLEADRSEAILIIANDLWDHVAPGEGCEFYRTSANCGGPAQMTYDIYVPLNSVDIALPPMFDPFIFATPGKFRAGVFGGSPGRGLEIHLKNQAPTEAFDLTYLGKNDDASDGTRYFQTTTGMPWVLELSQRWAHPLSGVDLIVAYPDFVEYVESEGSKNKDWYTAERADTANTFVE